MCGFRPAPDYRYVIVQNQAFVKKKQRYQGYCATLGRANAKNPYVKNPHVIVRAGENIQ